MSKILSYRGRTVTQADITFLKDVIAAHPDDSRCALSRRVCKAWEWTQPNGQLKDMVCRGLLLHLEREGYIIQPPPKRIIGQYRRKRPEPIEIDTTPINVPLKKVRSHLHFKQVRRTPDEKLFNSLIEQYHYLNYAQPVGEHLKYIVFCEQRPVACLAFSSAAFALNVRDGFIGWSKEQRDNNRHLLAYNTRFLILPWIQVKFLASHLLLGPAGYLQTGRLCIITPFIGWKPSWTQNVLPAPVIRPRTGTILAKPRAAANTIKVITSSLQSRIFTACPLIPDSETNYVYETETQTA